MTTPSRRLVSITQETSLLPATREDTLVFLYANILKNPREKPLFLHREVVGHLLRIPFALLLLGRYVVSHLLLFCFRGHTLKFYSNGQPNRSKRSAPAGFRYFTEFRSHEGEFDYLKSLEIEEKINQIKWCRRSTDALMMLTTNGNFLGSQI